MSQMDTYSGRLYLAKGNEEVFVDVEQTLPYQLQGIRFLYRQFKKENSGVILNDPTGYGKTRQVILFIQAIKHLLSKPIMVLCGEHEKNLWWTHFRDFTDYGESVMVEPPNLYLKKMSVCINTKRNVESLLKREWSILIIDDDIAINDILKRKKVNADFKIWLTSVDMKTNLTVYWKIFAWMFPKEENMEKILSERKAKPGSIEEQILIDATMENVVLRRVHNGSTAIGNKAGYEDTKIKTFKKNKDKSGTKIKRSKIKKCDEISNILTSDDECVDIRRKAVDDSTKSATCTIVENVAQSNSLINITDCIHQPVVNNEMNTNTISSVNHNDPSIVQITKMTKHESPGKSKIGSETQKSIEIESDEISNSPNHCNKYLSIDCGRNNDEKETVNTTNEQDSPEKIKENKNEGAQNKSIDEYVKEMEEKALRKFKGSFLDTIF